LPVYLHPATFLILQLAALYLIRPISVAERGEGGARSIGYFQTAWDDPNLTGTVGLVAIACIIFVALAMGGQVLGQSMVTKLVRRTAFVSRPGRLLIVPFLVSAVSAILVVRTLSEFRGGIFSALTLRQQAFEGLNVLVWTLGTYKWSLFAWIAASIHSPTRKLSLRQGLLLWLATVPFDLLTGSRAELVLRNLLVAGGLLILSIPSGSHPYREWSHGRGRRAVTVLVTVLIGALAFSGLRLAVREERTFPTAGELVRSTAGLPSSIFTENEGNAFDILYRVREAVPADTPHRGNESLKMIASAPLPRTLVPEKPERSGHVLTRELWPSLFSRGGNVAISGLADGYFSFGILGVLMVAGLLGLLSGVFAVGLLSKHAIRASDPSFPVMFVLAMAFAMGLFSVIRSDLAALGVFPVRIALVLGAILLGARPLRRRHGG
jgi:hypothetical protein